jgi:hypothetical protein
MTVNGDRVGEVEAVEVTKKAEPTERSAATATRPAHFTDP